MVELARDFRDPIGPRRMVGPGQKGLSPRRTNYRRDLLGIGRNHDFSNAVRLLGAAPNMHHHGLAGDVCESLARQTG